MHKSQTELEERSTFLPGSEDRSSTSAASAGAVILLFPFPPRTAAAEWAWEEEASSSDLPPSIGELAVRIVGNLNMPRLVVFAAPEAWEEEGSGAYDRR